MINKPPPFKGLNIRIPTIIPIKGRGFINQGSGLGYISWCSIYRRRLKTLARSNIAEEPVRVALQVETTMDMRGFHKMGGAFIHKTNVMEMWVSVKWGGGLSLLQTQCNKGTRMSETDI